MGFSWKMGVSPIWSFSFNKRGPIFHWTMIMGERVIIPVLDKQSGGWMVPRGRFWLTSFHTMVPGICSRTVRNPSGTSWLTTKRFIIAMILENYGSLSKRTKTWHQPHNTCLLLSYISPKTQSPCQMIGVYIVTSARYLASMLPFSVSVSQDPEGYHWWKIGRNPIGK